MPAATMIERISRALCIAVGLDPDRKFKSSNWDDGTVPHDLAWHAFQPKARAVLEAMRDPTDAMCAAAERRADEIGAFLEMGPSTVWSEMIDGALAEPLAS